MVNIDNEVVGESQARLTRGLPHAPFLAYVIMLLLDLIYERGVVCDDYVNVSTAAWVQA